MDVFISLFYHASKYRNSLERNKKTINLDINDVIKIINQEILFALAPIPAIESKLYEFFKEKLKNQCDESHRFITPISYKDLRKYCNENNIDINELKYNKKNNIT